MPNVGPIKTQPGGRGKYPPPAPSANGHDRLSEALPLSDRDLADLRASGLTDDTVRANGLRTERDPVMVADLLNQVRERQRQEPPWFCRDGVLVFPYRRLDGTADGFARVKPSAPRVVKGKEVKYESPRGAPLRAYFPAAALGGLRGTADVYVTEGEKKALALSQLGLAAVGLGGVWCGCRGTALIDDLAAVPWEGRTVFICFDYDPKEATRRDVAAAARRLAGALRAAGAGDVRAVELPPGPGGDKQGADDFLVARGAGAFRALVGAAVPVAARVLVVLGTDEHRVNAEAESALAARAEGLYQRGGQLVRVARAGRPDGKQRVERPDEAPVTRALPAALLREELSRHVDFVQPGPDGDRPAHVPGYAVSAIAARGAWDGLPHLEAVYAHPVLLPDGSVLAEPGFHEGSGSLLWLPEGLRVEVRDRPSRFDAQRAKTELLDVVRDFPFKTREHRAAWVASLLTPLARPAFAGPVPLFLVDANVPGIGKGLLVDVVCLAVLGRPASVTGYTNDREELRKAITTLALEGDEVVLLDNLSGSFGNDVLDRALTATWWRDRVLGGNHKYDGPLRAVWFGTGNNVCLVGDTVRRVLHVRLESLEENPEERSGFGHPDLRGHVLANRGRLLSAALTILRAYHVAGRPAQKLGPWGSFEGWSDLVRGAVVWCGLPDPGATREELRRVANPEREAVSALLAGIRGLDPEGQGLTAVQIIDRSRFSSTNPAVRALWDALLVLCAPRGRPEPSPVSLGNRLHNLRGRVVGGLCLEKAGTSHKTGSWRVVVVGELGGAGGTCSGRSASGDGAGGEPGGTGGTSPGPSLRPLFRPGRPHEPAPRPAGTSPPGSPKSPPLRPSPLVAYLRAQKAQGGDGG
jgi:hypothetical protein